MSDKAPDKFQDKFPGDSVAQLALGVQQVADLYAGRFDINRDDLWYLAKVSEEAGELTAAYLKTTSRGRTKDLSPEELKRDLDYEAADLFAHLLLFCDHNNIDLVEALKSKWLSRL